jgi:hypothetical protein
MELTNVAQNLTVPATMALTYGLSATLSNTRSPVFSPGEDLSNVPKHIRGDVAKVLKGFNEKVKTVDLPKDSDILHKEIAEYNFLKEDLLPLINFEGLNITRWDNNADLMRWMYKNADMWVNPDQTLTKDVTDPSNSSTEPHDGWVMLVPGDIVRRGGVSGMGILCHWGIYMGKGYILDVLRYAGDIRATISLTSMSEFLYERKYPLEVVTTISKDHENGGYTDLRLYNREVTIWAAMETMSVHFYYSGVRQNCENYVRTLLFGENISRQVQIVATGVGGAGGAGAFLYHYILKKNVVMSKSGCECKSRCGTYLRVIGNSWCWVDDECGEKNELEKHRSKYYDHC